MLKENNLQQDLQDIYEEEITEVDTHEITKNLVGYFRTLIDIDKKNEKL